MTRHLIPVGAVLFYAVSYPIGALAVSVVSPFALIAGRFAVTSVVLWSWLLYRRARSHGRTDPLPRGAQLRWAVLAGALVHGGQFLGLYWAMAHGVAPGVCALVIAMNPVATAMLNRLFGGASENRWGYLALTSGAAGVIAACGSKLVSDPRLGGEFAVTLVALFALAAGSLLQGRHLTGLSPVVFTAIGTTASTPPAVLLALSEKTRISDLPHAALLLGLLVITSALGTALYAACVRRSGARQASMLFAVIPAVAALADWLIQGSAVGAWTLFGLGLGSLACVAQVRSARVETSPALVPRPGRSVLGR
jgi:drug/metabolite transporter (DMT)-like permease